MKKRNKGSAGGNLDSLLDTMTNVVGILVILLVVTQLGVGAAVKRIKGFVTEVSAAEFEATEKEADELNNLLEQKDLDWKTIEPGIPQERLKIEELKKLIAQLLRDLELIQNAQIDTTKLKQRVMADRQRVKELELEIDQGEAELAKLRAQLDETPRPGRRPPAKVINLPNPRAAPKGAKRVIFICQHGRVLPVDVTFFQKRAQRAIRQSSRELTKHDGIDCQRLVELFEKKEVGNKLFSLKIRIAGGKPYLMMHHREKGGETASQIRRKRSLFQKAVRSLNKNEQYARFMVWSDSYDVYLRARKIAQEAGLLAGWIPYDNNYVWQVGLGVNVTCSSGKPPVKPKPPMPKPPTTKPKPKPKPTPKPTPKPKPKPKPRPPLPSDEID